jgi:hypothetical protein
VLVVIGVPGRPERVHVPGRNGREIETGPGGHGSETACNAAGQRVAIRHEVGKPTRGKINNKKMSSDADDVMQGSPISGQNRAADAAAAPTTIGFSRARVRGSAVGCGNRWGWLGPRALHTAIAPILRADGSY